MAISKVLLNETTQIDISDKTAEVNSVKTGITAHTSSGNQIVGDCEIGEVENVWCNATSSTFSVTNGTISNGVISWTNPTTTSYQAVLQGLQFRWFEAKNLKVQISFDYSITGLTAAGKVQVRIGTFEQQNPVNGNAVQSSLSFYIGENDTGSISGHFSITPQVLVMEEGTPVDTHYVGVRIYAPTGAGSTVQLSNIQMGFYMPVEDAIITRHFSGEYTNSEVTTIRNGAFYSCPQLGGVNFPNAENVLGYTFCYCSKLSNVSMPNLQSIGEATFVGCTGITSAEYSLVTTIGPSAFQSCTSLSYASFSNATYIGVQAFSSCTNLQSVSCPQVSELGNYAFFRCYSLQSFVSPSLKKIGGWAFEGCSSLSLIDASGTTNIANNAFKSCRSLQSVSFPNCTSLGSLAFQYASSLTSVHIPKVTNITQQCFDGCISLSQFDFSPVVSISRSAFTTTKLTSAHCPNTTNITGSEAFRSCPSLSTVVFEKQLTNTAGYLVANCPSLSIYDGRGRIAGNDFSGCTALTTLILRSTETALVTLGSTNAFTGTPFDSGGAGGTIYIPEALYNHLGDGTSLDYKAASNWSTMDSYGTITWAKIEGSYYEDHWGDGTARSA